MFALSVSLPTDPLPFEPVPSEPLEPLPFEGLPLAPFERLPLEPFEGPPLEPFELLILEPFERLPFDPLPLGGLLGGQGIDGCVDGFALVESFDGEFVVSGLENGDWVGLSVIGPFDGDMEGDHVKRSDGSIVGPYVLTSWMNVGRLDGSGVGVGVEGSIEGPLEGLSEGPLDGV